MNKPTPEPSVPAWHAGFEQWTEQIARLNRSADPFGINASMIRVTKGWLAHPAVLKQYYLLYTHWSQEALFDTPGVTQKDKRRTTFWARQWLNAVAPMGWYNREYPNAAQVPVQHWSLLTTLSIWAGYASRCMPWAAKRTTLCARDLNGKSIRL